MSESTTDTTTATPDAPPPPPRRTAPIVAGAVGVVVVVALVAYFALRGGSADDSADTTGNVTHVKIGQGAGKAATPTTLDVPRVAKIRAELPAKYRTGGSLTIGEGALPTGFPPLAFVGSDNKTLTGAEPDFGRLVAAVLGLQPKITNATWENLFVGIDAGTSDVGFSNITDTEERKQKYDFASYRQDNLALATLGTSKLHFTGDPSVLAGLKIAVSSGTNQEKILQGWQAQLKAKGKSFAIKYFPDDTATWTALESGQIDAYFGPNPSISYQEAQTGKKFRTAGTFSGAGASLQGLIAATTKKGNGLAKPVADAINYLIEHGQYAKWLAAYNLSNEAVKRSEINPPGLPLDSK